MDKVKNKNLEFLRDLKVRLELKSLEGLICRVSIFLYSKTLGKAVSYI